MGGPFVEIMIIVMTTAVSTAADGRPELLTLFPGIEVKGTLSIAVIVLVIVVIVIVVAVLCIYRTHKRVSSSNYSGRYILRRKSAVRERSANADRFLREENSIL